MATFTVNNVSDNLAGQPIVAGSLRAAVESAKAGDVIKFASSLEDKTIALKRPINITQNVTVDGANAKGVEISGNNQTIVFRVTGDGRQFTVRNLTIADGFHQYTGSGIWVQGKNSTIKVHNSKFLDNTAQQGAAIWAKAGAKVTITDSKFSGNEATGRGIDSAAGAVSVFEKSKLVVRRSDFTNNTGDAGGAIGTVFTELTIEDSTFSNNRSRRWGGAVHNDGASVPNQERYYKGDLPRDSVGKQTIIRNSIFENNSASHTGGGLSMWGYDQDYLTIANCKFINNEVKDSNGIARGGAMHVSGFVTIKDTTISKNTSAREGGGIWYLGEVPVKIENTNFSENTAGGQGGAIFNGLWGAETIINGSTFKQNSANDGGAMYAKNNRPIKVSNSIFQTNSPNNFGGNIKGLSGAQPNSLAATEIAVDGSGDDQNLVQGGKDDDRLTGTKNNDLLAGRGGDDVLIGGRGADVFVGGSGGDRYVLGVAKHSFYTKTESYVTIRNFDTDEDTLQLHGKASDYVVKPFTSDGRSSAGILLKGDLIALVRDSSPEPFSLGAAYVEFV